MIEPTFTIRAPLTRADRPQLTRFWWTPQWHAYEAECGQEPGTRARQLETATWQTRVLDLSASETELWAGVRRSYHSPIHRLQERTSGFWCIEANGGTFVVVGSTLHFASAQRETRPAGTWSKQGLWIEAGMAVSYLAWRHDAEDGLRPIGFLYAVVTGQTAYYFSAVARLPWVGHLLQWNAIRDLKARGVRWYELGWIDKPDFTEKEKSIAFAKRGWGGVDVAVSDCYRNQED